MPSAPSKRSVAVPSAKTFVGPLVNAAGVLRQRLTSEDWQATATLAIKTLALADKSVERILQREAAQTGTLLCASCGSDPGMPRDAVDQMRKYARSANGRKLLAIAAQELRQKPADVAGWLADDVDSLARGEPLSARLQGLSQVSTLVTGDPMWPATTVAVAPRSLLVLCHCEFNTAFRRAAKARSTKRSALGLAAHVAALNAQIGRLEAAIRKAADAGKDDRVRGALQRASVTLARLLPKLAGRIAPASYLARVSRNGSVHAPENLALGRSTLEAANLLREGIAAYCACIELLTRPDRLSVLKQLAALPFEDGEVRSSALSECGEPVLTAWADELRSGSEVVVEGYVTGTSTWRGSDGKLHSMVQLLAANGDERITAVCLYLHLAHRGIASGAYCRLAGIFRRSSTYAKGRPAIEIGRWDDVRQKRTASWHNGFVALADHCYPVFPNGDMIAWALSPQRVSVDKKGPDFWGAGEAVWAPLAHGWSKDYAG